MSRAYLTPNGWVQTRQGHDGKEYKALVTARAPKQQAEYQYDHASNVWRDYSDELEYGRQLEVVDQMSQLDQELLASDAFHSNGYEIYKKEDPVCPEEYLPEVIWRASNTWKLRAAPQHGAPMVSVKQGEVDWVKEYKWWDRLLTVTDTMERIEQGLLPQNNESLFDEFEELTTTNIINAADTEPQDPFDDIKEEPTYLGVPITTVEIDDDVDNESMFESWWAPPRDSYVGVWKENDELKEKKDELFLMMKMTRLINYSQVVRSNEDGTTIHNMYEPIPFDRQKRWKLLCDAVESKLITRDEMEQFITSLKWIQRKKDATLRHRGAAIVVQHISTISSPNDLKTYRNKLKRLYTEDKEFNALKAQATIICAMLMVMNVNVPQLPSEWAERKLKRNLHYTKSQWSTIYNAIDSCYRTLTNTPPPIGNRYQELPK